MVSDWIMILLTVNVLSGQVNATFVRDLTKEQCVSMANSITRPETLGMGATCFGPEGEIINGKNADRG